MNIDQVLEESPALLATLAVKVMEERRKLREGEQRIKVSRAMLVLKNQDAKNAMIINSKVDADKEHQKIEGEVIQLKANVEIAEIGHDRKANEYRSAHKMAKMDAYERNAWAAQSPGGSGCGPAPKA